MTTMQALRQFALDVPNILVSIIAALTVWLIADVMGKEPDGPETIWFGLCAAGFYYHIVGLRELMRDRAALLDWPEHDATDMEVVEGSIRREQARLIAKGVFGLAGLISIFLPPRIIPQYDALTQLVIILMIVAVVALDIDAIMDRLARRRQLALIKVSIEKRRKRRQVLEAQFAPLFEAVATATSERGRMLAHNIRGKMSLIVGTVEILKVSPRLNPEEMALVQSIDEAVDEAMMDIVALHELVRDLAIGTEVHDGPSGAEGPVRAANQP
jgi:hypothetical protein